MVKEMASNLMYNFGDATILLAQRSRQIMNYSPLNTSYKTNSHFKLIRRDFNGIIIYIAI